MGSCLDAAEPTEYNPGTILVHALLCSGWTCQFNQQHFHLWFVCSLTPEIRTCWLDNHIRCEHCSDIDFYFLPSPCACVLVCRTSVIHSPSSCLPKTAKTSLAYPRPSHWLATRARVSLFLLHPPHVSTSLHHFDLEKTTSRIHQRASSELQSVTLTTNYSGSSRSPRPSKTPLHDFAPLLPRC